MMASHLGLAYSLVGFDYECLDQSASSYFRPVLALRNDRGTTWWGVPLVFEERLGGEETPLLQQPPERAGPTLCRELTLVHPLTDG